MYVNVVGTFVYTTWAATSTTNAPDARYAHTAVWTGGEMIVWGGFDGTNPLNTGGKYNPGTDTWTTTGTANAPSSRYDHTAVWTDNEMIIWGGNDNNQDLNTGGRYNPNTDSWTATSTSAAPTARELHTAVWTNSQMIVWGGTLAHVDGRGLNPMVNQRSANVAATAIKAMPTVTETAAADG
jgi:N-acetylneuraminic acid mutarotase